MKLLYNKDKELIDKIEYGSTINIEGILKEPSNNTIPNTFNYKKYLNNKNIFYIINISNIKDIHKPTNIIYILKNKINKRINKIDKKGYIKSFILGDKSNIDNNIYKCYQNSGISHLFALSGMHISLIIIIIKKLTKKININIQTIIEIIILITYGFIVNFPSSIKRCILFYIINKIFKILKIEIESIKILIIVILILLIYNPKIIYDTGFLYSITTVGGILLSQNIIKDNSKIKSSIKLSIIAFIFSLPISLYTFYSINILSIIYNLFYIPFISIIIYLLYYLWYILLCFDDRKLSPIKAVVQAIINNGDRKYFIDISIKNPLKQIEKLKK